MTIRFTISAQTFVVGMYVPEEEIQLNNAACVMMELIYFRHGSAYFSTHLTITADESTVGGSTETVSPKWRFI